MPATPQQTPPPTSTVPITGSKEEWGTLYKEFEFYVRRAKKTKIYPYFSSKLLPGELIEAIGYWAKNDLGITQPKLDDPTQAKQLIQAILKDPAVKEKVFKYGVQKIWREKKAAQREAERLTYISDTQKLDGIYVHSTAACAAEADLIAEEEMAHQHADLLQLIAAKATELDEKYGSGSAAILKARALALPDKITQQKLAVELNMSLDTVQRRLAVLKSHPNPILAALAR